MHERKKLGELTKEQCEEVDLWIGHGVALVVDDLGHGGGGGDDDDDKQQQKGRSSWRQEMQSRFKMTQKNTKKTHEGSTSKKRVRFGGGLSF